MKIIKPREDTKFSIGDIVYAKLFSNGLQLVDIESVDALNTEDRLIKLVVESAYKVLTEKTKPKVILTKIDSKEH